jgi:hypothetical protein
MKFDDLHESLMKEAGLFGFGAKARAKREMEQLQQRRRETGQFNPNDPRNDPKYIERSGRKAAPVTKTMGGTVGGKAAEYVGPGGAVKGALAAGSLLGKFGKLKGPLKKTLDKHAKGYGGEATGVQARRIKFGGDTIRGKTQSGQVMSGRGSKFTPDMQSGKYNLSKAAPGGMPAGPNRTARQTQRFKELLSPVNESVRDSQEDAWAHIDKMDVKAQKRKTFKKDAKTIGDMVKRYATKTSRNIINNPWAMSPVTRAIVNNPTNRSAVVHLRKAVKKVFKESAKEGASLGSSLKKTIKWLTGGKVDVGSMAQKRLDKISPPTTTKVTKRSGSPVDQILNVPGKPSGLTPRKR